MSERAQVELTIRYGPYGSQSKSVAVDIPEDLARELMNGVELSDDPFSLMVASLCMFGGRGDAVTIRRIAFKMRRSVANVSARAMVPAMLKEFGVNDELDGYKLDNLSPEELEFHRKRGRIA